MTHTTRPRLVLPDGACDTHMHIYDDRYPASESAWLFPRNSLVPEYQQMQQRLGLSRAVIVQPVTYGFDNRCTLDAVQQMGSGARCVVTVPVDIPDAQLAVLWEAGARGLRFHQMRGGMLDWPDLTAMAARIEGSGWNVQVQLDGMDLPLHEDRIAALPCTVVLDHMGRFSGRIAPDHPAVRSLLRLAARGNVHVKLSGAAYVSRQGRPDYADIAWLPKALGQVSTDRLLWGSDWPHPVDAEDDKPDDAQLVDLLLDWGFDQTAITAILRDNPARLYGF